MRDLIDPTCVPDVYCSGLAEVLDLGGGNYRFVFFTHDHSDRLIVAKLIAPFEAIPPAMLLTARQVGLQYVGNQYQRLLASMH